VHFIAGNTKHLDSKTLVSLLLSCGKLLGNLLHYYNFPNNCRFIQPDAEDI